MALKPIPRLILIVAAVGACAFGINAYMASKKQNENAAGTATAQAAPVAVPAPVAAPAVLARESAVVRAAPSASAGLDKTYQSIVDKGLVRVSVQSPAKPFYSVERGAPQGFNVEFLRLLFGQSEFTAKHAQITIDTDHAVDTYSEVPKSLLKLDNRGNAAVDIAIDGLTFADEDLPGVVYTIPYVSDFGYSLITPARSAIASAADLRGLSVGVLAGDPDVKAFMSQQFPGVKVVELSDAAVNGERSWINAALKGGKVDAVVYDYPFAVAEIAGTDLQFAASKLAGSNIQYKIGVRKGDTQLLENLNVAIRKTKSTDAYISLLRSYFMSNNVAKVSAASAGEGAYVVRVGDTLSVIAGKLLGSTARYKEIEARNNLPNPNLIQVGQKLVIPKI